MKNEKKKIKKLKFRQKYSELSFTSNYFLPTTNLDLSTT